MLLDPRPRIAIESVDSHSEYWSRRRESNPQPAVYKFLGVGATEDHTRAW
jgi:hypothetical protein